MWPISLQEQKNMSGSIKQFSVGTHFVGRSDDNKTKNKILSLWKKSRWATINAGQDLRSFTIAIWKSNYNFQVWYLSNDLL